MEVLGFRFQLEGSLKARVLYHFLTYVGSVLHGRSQEDLCCPGVNLTFISSQDRIGRWKGSEANGKDTHTHTHQRATTRLPCCTPAETCVQSCTFDSDSTCEMKICHLCCFGPLVLL